MNFDNIKSALENDDQAPEVPASLAILKGSEMPIYKIRQRMKYEIITQFVCIAFFFAAPALAKMNPLPLAVYYITMFLTGLMTLGYLAKMSWFLAKTGNLQTNTRDALVSFIHDIELTLEVYKTAIISGSLLLPLSMAAFFVGRLGMPEEIFNKWFLLNVNTQELLFMIAGYILTGLFICIITFKWTDSLYGKLIDNLKETLALLQE